jgi:hypothetical protein
VLISHFSQSQNESAIGFSEGTRFRMYLCSRREQCTGVGGFRQDYGSDATRKPARARGVYRDLRTVEHQGSRVQDRAKKKKKTASDAIIRVLKRKTWAGETDENIHVTTENLDMKWKTGAGTFRSIICERCDNKASFTCLNINPLGTN